MIPEHTSESSACLLNELSSLQLQEKAYTTDIANSGQNILEKGFAETSN